MNSNHSHNGSAPHNWVGVGRSSSPDAAEAGDEAAQSAIAGRDPKLLIVFCSHSYDLQKLLDAINARSHDVPLIGCSTAGEIAASGVRDSSVVITAIGGEGFSVRTTAAIDASEDLRLSGSEAAAALTELDDRPNRVLMLLTDGLAGDQQEIVRGAYSVAGAGVPLVGGCAGDDLKMQSTYQLHGHQVLEDAVVSAAIGSDEPIGIGVRHGWRRVGEPMLITDSSENVVRTIDDRPALDVYLERLNAPAEVRSESAAFINFAQTHPLGLDRQGGEDHVRFVGDADFEKRTLACIARVPQGGLAWLMEGSDDSVLAATDEACSDAIAGLDGHRPAGMLAFDCIARRGVLGDEGVAAEVDRVAQHSEGAPVAGFYTYGEIARTQGVTGFHNQTLVVMALSGS
ncbi:MAG: FIST N-terminal domain-containing protein [Solirubrobacterales bacterium]